MDEKNTKLKSDLQQSEGLGDFPLSGKSETVSSAHPNVSVTAKPGESAESLLRRFRQQVRDSGLMEKIEDLRFYQKPSQKKKHEEKLRRKKIAYFQKYSD